MTQSNWGAILKGEQFDLDDWQNSLKPPFDPWLEKQGANLVLRSKRFDELTSGEQVHTRAQAYLDRLNGAFAISRQAKPVSLDGVAEITPDGQHHIYRFATGIMDGRSKVHAASQAIGPDGNPMPPTPPQASEVQHWSELADRDELLDSALIFFGKTTWFDIYNSLESLENRVGGEKNFLALGWEPEDEIKRLKRSANWGRHAKGTFDPPPDPMPMKDGRNLLGRLIRRAFNEEKS